MSSDLREDLFGTTGGNVLPDKEERGKVENFFIPSLPIPFSLMSTAAWGFNAWNWADILKL